MKKHLLENLFRSLSGSKDEPSGRRSRAGQRGRQLRIESLESRQMLSITPLQTMNSSGGTGEKPQSKVFEYAGQWWSVMPSSGGTYVYRLDGTSWTQTQRITTNSSVHADVKLVGDLAHVLLFDGANTQLATLQYDLADNRFEAWAARPQLVNLPLDSGVETATIEVDSTGRMWVASDVTSTVVVRYSDGLYTSWSAPITVASGIKSDDISTIIAMPNNQIGVFWSNQNTKLFGFRLHADGTNPTLWSADERPASQSALSVGAGMADDHMHLAVTSDGTLYAAVKTSYDKSPYPKMALLVRRPNGTWDNLYAVDTGGTRPTIIVSEAAGKVLMAYESNEGGGDILYRETAFGAVNLSPVKVMISGSLADVTTAKVTSTNQVVIMADNKSVLYTFDAPPVNQAPIVNAGADRTAIVGTPIYLQGSASDDNLPAPAQLALQWSIITAPGTVTFGNAAAANSSVSFGAAGTYVLQLNASDGQLSRSDQVSIVVSAATPPGGGGSGGGTGNNTTPRQLAFQNGLFPSVAYAGSVDTKIAAKKATTNYGNDAKMTIDGNPDEAGLFKWNVSAIPVGSTVQSVAIEFNVTASSKDSYEVYALQRAWDELSATWQRYAIGQNWSTAGANNAADASAAVLGQLSATSKGTYRINLNAAGVAAVQAWINDPSKNYGIIIKDYAVAKAVEIATSEASTASQRPKLIINFTDPAPVNAPPTVDVGVDRVAQVGQPLVLNATVTDDGLPNPPALMTALWTKSAGPGTATFANGNLVNTSVTFDAPGIYTLRLTVNDSLLSVFDELVVSVI